MALFDLISDFHVEVNTKYSSTSTWKEGDPYFFAWNKGRKSDLLVIAGDTANNCERAVTVIKEAARYYDRVLFTDGNHEHYDGHRDPSRYNYRNNIDFLRKFAKDHDKVIFLDGETEYLDNGTLYIGACGWYDFKFAIGYHTREQKRQWHLQSNDPVCIRFGKKHRPEKLALLHANFLQNKVVNAQKNDDIKEIVVITHTVPHKKGLITDMSHPWYPLNGAYGNSLMRHVIDVDRSKKIKVWCFGHTHFKQDFVEYDIRFVTNPRGYHGELRNYGSGVRGFDGLMQIDTNEPMIESIFGTVKK